MNTLPTIEYVGDATVIDRAEFARLIKKFKSLRVSLFLRDSEHCEFCQNNLASFDVPAKQALDKLACGDLDAFEWRLTETGPRIWHYAAPARLQLLRRQEFLLARIPKDEARIALYKAKVAEFPTEEWRAGILASCAKDLASDQAELAKITAKLNPTPAAAVA